MLSQLKPSNVDVLSLTTIATPHRGSAFADYMFDTIGRTYLRVRRGSRLILPSDASETTVQGHELLWSGDWRVFPVDTPIYDRDLQPKNS
jgi:hypothetical protein